LDWSWDFIFPRDLGFLNTDTTKQATHAYYRPGDFIHRQGEPARVFSIIEDGQVEVLQKDSQTLETKVIGVLGKGDFFGEGALLGNRPQETSIRARSAVRLRQVGSALFSELAGSFAPLRDQLVQAVTRRSGDFWRRLPISKSILEGESLASLLDPLPAELLNKDTKYADAIKALNESASGHLLIVDEKQRLWGTLDRNDLYQIIARVAADGREDFSERRLAQLLPANPVYVALEDSPLAASATMLDHGISWLPVVKSKDDPRPVGRLRGDRITRRLIEKMAQVETAKVRAAS
jgi:signal-transduction protein with cAMP-binding, CBS, and nucleotidyltransferase domain